MGFLTSPTANLVIPGFSVGLTNPENAYDGDHSTFASAAVVSASTSFGTRYTDFDKDVKIKVGLVLDWELAEGGTGTGSVILTAGLGSGTGVNSRTDSAFTQTFAAGSGGIARTETGYLITPKNRGNSLAEIQTFPNRVDIRITPVAGYAATKIWTLKIYELRVIVWDRGHIFRADGSA